MNNKGQNQGVLGTVVSSNYPLLSSFGLDMIKGLIKKVIL